MTPSPGDHHLPRPLRIAVAHRNSGPDWPWVFPKTAYREMLEIESYGMPPEITGSRRKTFLLSLSETRRLWTDHRRRPFDAILSFMPVAASWVELFRGGQAVRHDCFAFNVTEVPRGLRLGLMRRAFRQLGQGFVLTEMERPLYEQVFGVPRDRLSVVPWGVARPEPSRWRPLEGPYVAALGGEARDYPTLFEAARLLTERRFVVVARPHSVAGSEPPANVTLLTNLPFGDAWGVVAGADFHVLPLVSSDTPCGIVTAVGAMHLGKAQVVTASGGVLEYAEDGLAAIGVPPGSPEALAAAIRQLDADPGYTAQLGAHAADIAARRFSEETTIRFAEHYLRSIATRPDAPVPGFVA